MFCYFCQLTQLNIYLSIETANGFQSYSLFLSSLIANMATILINFQQKFGLVRSFEHFAIKFLNQNRFLARLKSASKFSLSRRGKCDVVIP